MNSTSITPPAVTSSPTHRTAFPRSIATQGLFHQPSLESAQNFVGGPADGMTKCQSVFVFSDDFLVLRPGTIRYSLTGTAAETWSITVPLATFSATDEYDPRTFRLGSDGPVTIDTELRLDFVELPGPGLKDLCKQVFDFPVNPEAGYIDASIYLGGGHCPIDVTRIEFGTVSGNRITATLHTHFDFEAEAVEIANRYAVLTADLQLTD
ncbi:hypothetical protein [Nocardia asteroides]|uniref:hypothetical protein n=1 Tax=Nocardia asteroides TaxID=1824 RepID=UPI001E5B8FB3|nr:hypothetical protein [Nocardia asteroides]UGT58005.1 hypothetical protein LTT85_14705 [Nocardia asteroides]